MTPDPPAHGYREAAAREGGGLQALDLARLDERVAAFATRGYIVMRNPHGLEMARRPLPS